MRLFAGLVLFLVAGCSTLKVQRADSAVGLEPEQTIVMNGFVWGFIPATLPPEASLCPKAKIATVSMGRASGDVWLSIVTLGVYVPHRAMVSCTRQL